MTKPPCRRFPIWVAAVGLIVVTFVVHAPGLRGGFIWDDDAHGTPAALRTTEGLGRIWTEVGATQQYYPLLHSAFWLEHRLWGANPLGYHAANIGLHAMAAVLFTLVLRRLGVRRAVLAGLIFAVHPVHVETVAWVSEQKNTLSAVFCLGAALVYLKFDDTRGRGAYLGASALFALGLLTKTVVATVPAALLVLLWWRRGALDWRRDGLPLLPWLVVGAAAGLFTAWVERWVVGAEGPAFELAALERLLLAGRVVWFYLGKLLWPANLTFVYPRWTIDAAALSSWLPLAALLALLGFLWRRPHRGPLAVALLYVGMLFPVLGFLNVYPFQYSYVADHFQYLASLPLIAAVAIGSAGITASPGPRAARLMIALGVVALAIQARQRTFAFRDNETLFRDTVARNPAAWMAWNNLGKELMGSPQTRPEAIRCLERAIALRPAYYAAHNNLGLALTQSGRPLDAIPHLETALQLKPDVYQTHNNLGIALASSGRGEEALRAFAAAAALSPALPNIHENWAKALQLLGRTAEAEERFAVAARLRSTQIRAQP